MARHAIVDQTGLVVNVIIWAGAEFLPPRNHYVIQHDEVNIGDRWDFETNTLIKTIVISPDPEPEQPQP